MNSFVALPGKGDHSGLIPSRLHAPTWRGNEEFYSNGSKRVSSWIFFWLVDGDIIWNQPHQPSGSNKSGIYLLVNRRQLASPTWGGLQYLQISSKILFCVSLEGEPGPCPKASLLFLLTAPPLSPHPLFSLISNCLNLPLGIQGRSWRQNEEYFL